MYIPKYINKLLKEEAKRAGRTNMEGLVVAPAWSKLFLQADYVIAKQADEIERLRDCEAYNARSVAWANVEIERLRKELQSIADFDLYGDYSNAYEIPKIARDALKEPK